LQEKLLYFFAELIIKIYQKEKFELLVSLTAMVNKSLFEKQIFRKLYAYIEQETCQEFESLKDNAQIKKFLHQIEKLALIQKIQDIELNEEDKEREQKEEKEEVESQAERSQIADSSAVQSEAQSRLTSAIKTRNKQDKRNTTAKPSGRKLN
jgi:hypothetical protein